MLLFRPAGRVPFGSRPKRNQKGLPRHPALRFAPGSFAPSPFQGHAAKGHPWPIASLAASMPLNPLRNDSVRPTEGGSWSCLMVARRAGAIIREVQQKLSDSSEPESPSGGRVEMSRRGASRRDAARGITGQGWPVYAGPRSGIGRREPRRRRGRMSGGAFFCLLFFAQTKKSESPGGAKREVPVGSIIGLKANPSRLTQSCQRGIRAPHSKMLPRPTGARAHPRAAPPRY